MKDKEEAKLTKRENQIAELFAWGATKKDVANRLYISENTVQNHAENIFKKVGVTKINELSAWWFCTKFHISFDLSPLRRQIIASLLLVIMLPQMFDCGNIIRTFRNRTEKTCRMARRSDADPDMRLDFDF
jgi:DNA-binding NarL/FixJ family response regulator